MRRVIALVSLSTPDHPRVSELARVLVARGDRVTLYCPPGGGPAPEGVTVVRVGRAVSVRPRLLDLLRFGAELGVRAGLSLRRRYDVMLVHGGEEMAALLGALPRLSGTRLVLDLDAGASPPSRDGWRSAVASVARSPALRLVDAFLASSEGAAARLRGVGRERVATFELGPSLDALPRREKQPRVTVRSPVKVACRFDAEAETVRDRVLEALSLAHAADPRLAFEVEGLSEEQVRALAERLELPLEPCPPPPTAAWVERMNDVLMAILSGGGPEGALPYLAVGVPVLAIPEADLGEHFADGATGQVGTSEPEALAAALGRLVRSSRERRELMKRGWAWMESTGRDRGARKLFAAIDGEGERTPVRGGPDGQDR